MQLLIFSELEQTEQKKALFNLLKSPLICNFPRDFGK